MEEAAAYIPFFAIFILSGSLHEFFHAWSANRLGDPTSADMGRLTLNPLVHLDIVGSLLFPALTLYMMGFPIGWMKPVPVSPQGFRHPARDMLFVSLAGPYANLLLGFLGLIVLFAFEGLGEPVPRVVDFWILINLLLAFFNLLPIPPLDGSSIVDFIRGDRDGRYHAQAYLGFFLLYLFMIIGGFKLLWSWVTGAHALMCEIPALSLAMLVALLALGSVFLIKTRTPSRRSADTREAHPSSMSLYDQAVAVGRKKVAGERLTPAEAEWLEHCTADGGDGQPLCSPISFHGDNDFCATCDNFNRCAGRLVDLIVSKKTQV